MLKYNKPGYTLRPSILIHFLGKLANFSPRLIIHIAILWFALASSGTFSHKFYLRQKLFYQNEVSFIFGQDLFNRIDSKEILKSCELLSHNFSKIFPKFKLNLLLPSTGMLNAFTLGFVDQIYSNFPSS